MYINYQESLFEIIFTTAVEMLGVAYEAAANFAQVVLSKITGFIFRFDHVPNQLILKDVAYDGERFIATWESVSTQADCPVCGKTSQKEHSSYKYGEMVQDVGIARLPLWHCIYRKRYICTNDHCICVKFMETFPGFVEMRYSRMTVNFVDHVLDTAVNTSSVAAAKILNSQGAEISANTVTRAILRRGASQVEKNFYDNAGDVEKIGIDDINLRKGDSSTSCMVLVNLETKKLLGILRGTTGDTAQQALAMFPNLKIVSRDRGTAMASAANALGKKSVADRFHITANMHEAIERTLHEMLPKSMYIPVGNAWFCISNDTESGQTVLAEIPASLTEEDIKKRVRMANLSSQAERKYRDTLRVLELTAQGKYAEEISGITGIPVDKVRSLRSGMRETVSAVEKRIDEFMADPRSNVKKQKSVTTSAQHSSKSKVEPYRDTVEAMLKEGKSHWAIHEELCKQGFVGSHSTVDNYIIKLGRENGVYREIEEDRSAANDYFVPLPERPQRISVRIYSAKTVYNRVLARIRDHRDAKNGEHEGSEAEPSDHALDSKKKSSAIPASNRMNLPLNLVDVLNWRDPDPLESKKPKDADIESSVDSLIGSMYPVFGHMIQFGIDYHNFMDNNNVAGLHEFIEKYKGDSCWRLAKFAKGLQMDIDAVTNTLLYPDISNGVVEGMNNAVKCDKRVCGGRAKVDLLTARTVLRQLPEPSGADAKTA